MREDNNKKSTGQRLVGWTRFMATVPTVGLFISALVMTITTLIETISVTINMLTSDMTMQELLVDYIEYADFFLLSIVLYIMSIGLYSLFIDNRIDMPKWLEIHTLDDLKEKLVSVIAVVMGVFFLGQLLHGANAQDLMFMGAGIGCVVFAMAYFVKHVMMSHANHTDSHTIDEEDLNNA